MNFLLRKSYLLNIATVVILLKISIIHKSVSHILKSVFILNFSGPYVLSFGLNKEIYGGNLRIQSECEKNGPKKLRIRSVINSSSCEELSKYLVDLYSEPSQTSKIEFFVKTVHGFSLQKQPQEVLYKKGILNNFTKFRASFSLDFFTFTRETFNRKFYFLCGNWFVRYWVLTFFWK